MNNKWIKIFAVILISYTFIGGMWRPLNPGIMEIHPEKTKCGERIEVKVSTYNTHLDKGSNIAYLYIDSTYNIKSIDFKATSNNEAAITFDIPQFLPEKSPFINAGLIIVNPIDGGFARPSSVSIAQDSVNTLKGQEMWKQVKIEKFPDALHKGFPFRLILEETIRNIYYHVPFWMAMIILFSISVFYSIKYLFKPESDDAYHVYAYNRVGLFFGLMGLITGAIWAKNTWGQYWSGDIKQNMTAIALLIYAAYFILWKTFKDEQIQLRVSSAFNIFAFVAMIPLIFVIPRLYDSLHPGNGGNPALGGEDLDNTMRMVFYPAVIGYTLLGLWLANLLYRMNKIENHLKQ
ncbi:MAG: cytochrome c biogenesis protein CcsA [Saprospiraceae bacterium]|nr:cytochrome c biogenesis protein CcsA [Saprospiraceae bacterium]